MSLSIFLEIVTSLFLMGLFGFVLFIALIGG